MFYISEYLEAHRGEYVGRLRHLNGDMAEWNAWVEFFLLAITAQVEENLATGRKIIDLYNRLKEQVISLTHSQYAVPFLDCLFDRPVFSARHLEDRPELPSKQTITGMINRLKEAGILTVVREGSGRRPQILGFRELVNLCEGREVM